MKRRRDSDIDVNDFKLQMEQFVETYKRILTEYIDSEHNPYATKCKNIKDYLDKIDSSPFIGNTSSSNFEEEEDICSSINGLSIDKMNTS